MALFRPNADDIIRKVDSKQIKWNIDKSGHKVRVPSLLVLCSSIIVCQYVTACSVDVLVALILDQKQLEVVRESLLLVHPHFIDTKDLIQRFAKIAEDARENQDRAAAQKEMQSYS